MLVELSPRLQYATMQHPMQPWQHPQFSSSSRRCRSIMQRHSIMAQQCKRRGSSSSRCVKGSSGNIASLPGSPSAFHGKAEQANRVHLQVRMISIYSLQVPACCPTVHESNREEAEGKRQRGREKGHTTWQEQRQAAAVCNRSQGLGAEGETRRTVRQEAPLLNLRRCTSMLALLLSLFVYG